jgi:hypothetical protein
MAYGNALRFQANTLLTLAFGSFPVSASYGLIGTLPNVARIIHIQNLTNVNIFFSFDGVNDHDILVPSSFLLIDVSSNQSEMGGLYIYNGQSIYARYATGAPPTSGAVYVASFYGANGE